MEINTLINYSIIDKTDEEVFELAQKVKERIVILYEQNKLGDPDYDFEYGACGILASMIYNILPNRSKVYLSCSHVIVKVGNGYQSLNAMDTEETDKLVDAGVFYSLDLTNAIDREHFYMFLERCDRHAYGEYGKKLCMIENQVKNEMGFVYGPKDEVKKELTAN